MARTESDDSLPSSGTSAVERCDGVEDESSGEVAEELPLRWERACEALALSTQAVTGYELFLLGEG